MGKMTCRCATSYNTSNKQRCMHLRRQRVMNCRRSSGRQAPMKLIPHDDSSPTVPADKPSRTN
jgi:hypothetical protein